MSLRTEDLGPRVPALPGVPSSRLPPFSRGTGSPSEPATDTRALMLHLRLRALQSGSGQGCPDDASAGLGLGSAPQSPRLSSDGLLVEVPCPQAGHHVSLGECARCSECDGLVPGHEDGASAVACRYPPPYRGPSLGAAHATRQVEPAERREPTETEATEPERWALDPASHTAVTQIMTAKVTSVSPTLSVRALAGLFLAEGLSGAPVVDGRGRPIGIVTKTDLLGALLGLATEPARDTPASTGQALLGAAAAAAGGLAGEDIPVSAVMQPIPIVLRETDSVARAAAVMAFEGLHRVPVVAVNGALVGLVSSLDVLNWLALQSGYAVADHARRRPGSTPPPPLGVALPVSAAPGTPVRVTPA